MNRPHHNFDVETAFHKHGAFLRRLALALTTDPWAADDVLQETWLTASQSKAPLHSTRAWLATVVRRNVARSATRDQKRRQREESRRQPFDAEAPTAEQLMQDLSDLLSGMSADDRGLLIARFWEGLTAKEIAARHQTSINTIESRLRRALDKLRIKMDQKNRGNRDLWAGVLLSFGSKNVESTMKLGVILMSAKKLVLTSLALLLLLIGLWTLGIFSENKSATLSANDLGQEHAEALEPRRAIISSLDEQGNEIESAPKRQEELAPKDVPETGSLVVHLRHSSGEVASGVRIYATALDREIGLVEVSATTNESGRAHFAQLATGRHELLTPQSGQYTVQVDGAQENEITWKLPAGEFLHGTVLDADGSPISGAQLHLTFSVDPGQFGHVGTSAADGTFHIKDVRSASIVATAKGFAPSLIQDIPGSPTEPITLKLRPKGYSAVIEVVDDEGYLVPGAFGLVHDHSVSGDKAVVDDESAKPNTGHHSQVFTRRFRSDGLGLIQLDGMGADNCRVDLRAVGYLPQTVSIKAGKSGFHRIALSPDHKLKGRIIDQSGKPIEKVRVSRGPYRGVFRNRGFSNAKGEFEVVGLNPGRKSFDIDARELGEMNHDILIKNEPLTYVSITFKPGLQLHGVVLDNTNAPVPNLRIRSHPADYENQVTWRSAKTDANGKFTLNSVTSAAQRVEIFDPKQKEQPLLVIERLLPRQQRHTIRLSDKNRANSFMIGRVVNDQGDPIQDASIVIFGSGTLAASSRSVNDEGEFRYGPFAAGTYNLFVSAKHHPEVRREVTLSGGEDNDLGNIFMPRPGRAIAKLSYAANVAIGIPSGSIVSKDARSFDFHVKDNQCISPPLAPGIYTFTVRIANHIEASRVVEVKSGQDSFVDLRMELGSSVRISFVAKNKAVMPTSYHVVIEDLTGTRIMDREHKVRDGYGFQIYKVLPTGRYRFVIENDLGKHVEQQRTLSVPGGKETPVVLDISGR